MNRALSCIGFAALLLNGCAERATRGPTTPTPEPVSTQKSIPTRHPLATWIEGEGTLNKISACAGTAIHPGANIEAGPDRCVVIALTDDNSCEITLAPGAAATLSRETGSHPALERLVVQLDRGCLELHLGEDTSLEEVRVAGSVLELHSESSRLILERFENSADYVAVIEGDLVANLQSDLADILHQPEGIQLQSRQGLAANRAAGLSAIDQLNRRPRIPTTRADSFNGLRSYCMAAGVDSDPAGWTTPESTPPTPIVVEGDEIAGQPAERAPTP
jgi:hypothetical protein